MTWGWEVRVGCVRTVTLTYVPTLVHTHTQAREERRGKVGVWPV